MSASQRILPLILIICACHGLFILAIGFNWNSATPSVKREKNLLIQTVSLNTPHPILEISPEPQQEPSPSAAIENTPVEAPPPIPEQEKIIDPKAPPKKNPQESAKKSVKKEPIKAKAPVQKETSKAGSSDITRQETLLREAQESLAKINQKPHKNSKNQSLDLPKAIQSLKIDTENYTISTGNATEAYSRNSSYQDQLALHLKNRLQLPEIGEVKLQMTINRNGKLISMKVLNAESEKNRKYLEKSLPTLRFPEFGSFLEKLEHYTFTITLSNDF